MQNYTFTTNRTLPSRWKTKGRYSEIILGKDGETFPTSVSIIKVTQDSGVSVLRTLTSSDVTNRNILLETSPNSVIDVEIAGVSTSFYVELNNLTE